MHGHGKENQETVPFVEWIYTAFLHCNGSLVDSSLSESPLEALYSFLVPPNSYLLRSLPTYHWPSITHSSLLKYTTLVVIIPLATPTIANKAKSKAIKVLSSPVTLLRAAP